MRPSVTGVLALLAVLVLPACPLDIQVRDEEGADAGPRACTRDTDCPSGQRCDDYYEVCEPGPRLTEECSGFGTCATFASCEDNRCELDCDYYDCPLGYLCGPEEVCVEECTAGPPETLGDFCADSLDCTRCGFCVADARGAKRCHQPCSSDAECGGEVGACQQVGGTSFRVCRLPA